MGNGHGAWGMERILLERITYSHLFNSHCPMPNALCPLPKKNKR
ncbi:hypothetical protein [[Scytonema hofmanni] UTEX B 1581]|nr:hypothetical protein [[Scytonema hofmanni] UTEX B 1581]